MKEYLIMLIFIGCSTYGYAEGLNSLAEAGQSMAATAKILDQETKNFNNVKKGIESGELKKAQAKEAIRQRYGEPVLAFDKDKNSRETWVYKPASSSYFEGSKIYLYFDDNGNLDETKILEQAKPAKQ